MKPSFARLLLLATLLVSGSVGLYSFAVDGGGGVLGVVNPSDVFNGWYPDLGPVAFSDREFQDRVSWVLEETGAEKADYYTLPVSCGPGPSPCMPYTPTFVALKKGSTTFDTGAREIVKGVEAVRIGALQEFGASSITLKWYPGYEARHPSNGNPIGEPWPDHPYARNGWKMFKPSAEDGAQWAPGDVFQKDQRKWRKWRSMITPGTLLSPGKIADAWEEVSAK